MKVLGIDPSLTSTGLAIVQDGQVHDLKRVRTKLTGHERIETILNAVRDAAAGCDAVGIEGAAMNAKGSSVLQIFGLWGVITHDLWATGRHYYVVTPGGRCKYATGKGNADKDHVLAAVIRRYATADVTGNDVADALVIAAMGARMLGEPLEEALPDTHLKAMDGVQW